MIIGHFSDLHADLTCLRAAPRVPDLWACTGDFFPNASRGDRRVEPGYQTRWFAQVASEFVALLRGRPLLWVQGNHDYVDLPELLRRHGHREAWTLGCDATFVRDGVVFAGFAGIAWIAGEWVTEMHQGELASSVYRALADEPHVLLTHSPPGNVLNNYPGIDALTAQLVYNERLTLRAHLFGHCHKHGGKSQRVGPRDVLCVNSARTLQFVDVTPDGAQVVP